MDFLISRLKDIGVSEPEDLIADCIDSGRVFWLIDYVVCRESLKNMEVDCYVR